MQLQTDVSNIELLEIFTVANEHSIYEVNRCFVREISQH